MIWDFVLIIKCMRLITGKKSFYINLKAQGYVLSRFWKSGSYGHIILELVENSSYPFFFYSLANGGPMIRKLSVHTAD